jgi:hypothetical protein
MPLFKRSDGTLVPNLSNVRRMIPYLMRGRNESIIYHDETYDLTLTKAWLHAYNRSHAQPATLFHLFLWAMGRVLNQRAGLNRFVSGGRIYERKGVHLSFAAKKKFRDEAPLVTVKVPFPPDEPFDECVRRIIASIDDGRSDEQRTVDKELKLAMALPGWLLRLVMALLRGLDRLNLQPGAMIANDPMYASVFVANLGSVGLDRTYHHLYEYGNISIFASLGTQRKALCVGPDDQPAVRDGIEVRWALDERINDGFYCATSLRHVQRIVENPEKYIGSPTKVVATDGIGEPATAQHRITVTPASSADSNGATRETP